MANSSIDPLLKPRSVAVIGASRRRATVGGETFFNLTPAGREACQRYRQVREDCLVKALGAFASEAPDELHRQIGDSADLLRALSGLYDQAARAAASL